ncbi:MAG: hypothetical protein U9R29_06640 [Thermodesulfobacteriota bacterium]|nr:hypothetical protein [Thermodesulfobacteriota bacterium]
MSRRRRNATVIAGAGHDSGKDLFAYLFLLMVIFVFVLLMTLHQVQGATEQTTAPTTNQPQENSLVKSINQQQFGVLVKVDDQLVLQFGDQYFRPQQDLEQLLASPYLLSETDATGHERKVLYLDADHGQQVLLTEYLSSFQSLSRAGIDVAFAKRME